MKKIKITQVKSAIDRPERQKLTLRALGLNKMNASREVVATDQILGMVRTVNHLIKIEETSSQVDTETAPALANAEAINAHPVEETVHLPQPSQEQLAKDEPVDDVAIESERVTPPGNSEHVAV
ncbi:MAG: 50S ribosomal protein L30 [Chitinophagaceae bacterium]